MPSVSNLFQSTTFRTVISGVIVFTFGQVFVRFVLDPLAKYKETVGRIDNRLKYYANAYGLGANLFPKEGGPVSPEMRKELLAPLEDIRALSCEFEAIYKQMPCRFAYVLLRLIPSRKNASDASSRLIRLSNYVTSANPNWDQVHADENKVRELLRIPSFQP